jgi:hypothetical protein
LKGKKFLTMFNIVLPLFFAIFAIFPAVALSQFQQISSSPRMPAVMPLTDIKEGMRGTATTVFVGNKPQEFNVEILGVLPNWVGPRQDIIIGKLSGTLAERTFVFAGMSGSPVYINGKLIGAISYSFPFAKEPICGITPFEQMTSLVEEISLPRLSVSRVFSMGELSAPVWKFDSPSDFPQTAVADMRMSAVAGQTIAPIATPLSFSGISQRTMDLFGDELRRAGFVAVAAAGGNSPSKGLKPTSSTTLLGGDSVVVHLSRGDVSISAAGTVTARDGNKIYAFGHPFFGLGSAELPMSESSVVTVVPNANNSFKLAVADSMVGTMTQDRSTGVYGILGKEPRMLPIKLNLTTSRGRTEKIAFESAFDSVLTPLIVNIGIANAITSNERSIGDATVEVSGKISLAGEAPIRIDRRFTGGQTAIFAASAPVIPLAALLRADFDGMRITGIDLDLKVIEGSRTATLDRITADKTQVRAGESVGITYFERTAAGLITKRATSVVIPKDANAGTLTITVADGGTLQQSANSTNFVAQNVAELIDTINRIKHADTLYAVITRTGTGTVIGSNELPNLPPSMLATINSDRSAGGSKAITTSLISEMALPIGENIVTGTQSITIEVIR